MDVLHYDRHVSGDDFGCDRGEDTSRMFAAATTENTTQRWRRTVGDIRLYHGGVPGLRVGDLIEPGHQRQQHDGCPWCEARARGEAYGGTDGPTQHPEHVYASTSRLYARFHASLWGRGDLYRVETVGEWVRSTEDSIESYRAPALRVAAVLDRAVLLTNSERRRLWREWGIADRAVAAAERLTLDVPPPRCAGDGAESA